MTVGTLHDEPLDGLSTKTGVGRGRKNHALAFTDAVTPSLPKVTAWASRRWRVIREH